MLAVKGNQLALEEAVQAVFERACADDFAGVRYDSHASVEDGHGWYEERYVMVIRRSRQVAAQLAGCDGRSAGRT
jgi:hypothetical protein